MPKMELKAGTIEYSDSGGSGETIVFLHGVVMNGTHWGKVVSQLEGDFRCVVPVLPLGAHREPMDEDADLSLQAIARLAGEFIEKLDLRDVTLVANDWGGAQVMVYEGCADRVSRLVLSSCESFDNFPPGLPGKLLGLSAKLPGGLTMGFAGLRVRPMRRLPLMFGWMTKRKVPAEVMDTWFEPMQKQRAIRRDFRKYANTLPSKAQLLEIAEGVRGFDRPALVIWAKEDKLMPPEHAHRLVEMLPDARLVEVEDSYTLIPQDQPELMAKLLREFISERREAPSPATP
ncbi:MAG TPA: alpha/beta hydrolase [Solirubrobacterales bacterium]